MTTHNAEQPVKVFGLLVDVRPVPRGAVDPSGRGGPPFAAFTTLALQLGVAALSQPLEVVRQRNAVQAAYQRVVHLQAVQRLDGRGGKRTSEHFSLRAVL